jgi:hypothetical protein
MLAALRSIGRVAHFAEGHLISEERAASRKISSDVGCPPTRLGSCENYLKVRLTDHIAGSIR